MGIIIFIMEGCLELKYTDSLKRGMSVREDGKPGRMSAFEQSKLLSCLLIRQGNNCAKEVVKKSLITSHRDYAQASKATAQASYSGWGATA